jgi:HSP20 family protein
MFLTNRNFSREASTGLQRLLNETLGGLDWQYRDSAAASWVPPVDIFEEADNIRIVAEIPGVQPEDIKISLEGNLLTIHGTKQQEAEEKTERVHRYERTYGAFERSFTLPASVEPKDIKANYDQGVLTITLPKSERAKPRQIEVQVGTGPQRVKGSQSGQNVEVNKGWSPEQDRAASRRETAEKQSR